MKKLVFILIMSLISVMGFAGKKTSQADKELLLEARDYFSELPKSIIDKKKNADLIHLGKKLYFEKKLSINGTISCNSCHNLKTYGVDNEPTSPGHDGTRGGRNSPTVYNAALHLAQFWDGRAKDVEEQALGPILNPIEHGLSSEKDALAKIDNSEYRELFKKAFKDEEKSFNYKNIGRAIGAFERTLLTPARFDDYLAGSQGALNRSEKRGLKKFIEVGCVSCHSGAIIGGDSYQMIGAEHKYPTKDLGRYEITKDEDDKFFFKVPSLRNVTQTAPYFHDGTVKTLDDAIRKMAWHQLGEKLSQKDIADIKSFLGTLTAQKLPKI